MRNFSKVTTAISTFKAPEEWRNASSMLIIHKY
jgi:hypothetical protein